MGRHRLTSLASVPKCHQHVVCGLRRTIGSRSPLAKTVKLGERSFALIGPSAWNNLPNAVKESENVESFKQRLKTLIFNMLQQTYVDRTMLNALDFGLSRAMAL